MHRSDHSLALLSHRYKLNDAVSQSVSRVEVGRVFCVDSVLPLCLPKAPLAGCPGAHFMNDFAIVIQILWKTGFSVTPLYGVISLQNFTHGTTAQLSCHVQNFITITSLQLIWGQNEFSSNLKLWWENRSWNGSQAGPQPLSLFATASWPWTEWMRPPHATHPYHQRQSLTTPTNYAHSLTPY